MTHWESKGGARTGLEGRPCHFWLKGCPAPLQGSWVRVGQLSAMAEGWMDGGMDGPMDQQMVEHTER